MDPADTEAPPMAIFCINHFGAGVISKIKYIYLLSFFVKIDQPTAILIYYNSKMNFTAIRIVKMKTSGVSRNLGGQIMVSVAILFILTLGLMVQKQLYSFLKTRNKRHVNKIIIFNFIVQNITIPIVLCYFLFRVWISNPSQYISDYGCHGISLVTQFMFIFDRSTSFFINLFRYICILHDTQLKKYDIHPKVKYISRLLSAN